MTNPTSVNAQMQQLAEEAVKVAAERFGQSLDYTENSLASFESLLQQAYELYSLKGSGNEIPEETIQITARVWGSYLGELMRRKWGGEWVVNGPDINLTISGKSCSPIQQIFKRITIGQLYDIKEFFANFASGMAEPKGEQGARAVNEPAVHEQIDLKKIKELIDHPSSDMAETQGKQEAQVFNEMAVDKQIDLPKPKEIPDNFASDPEESKREQEAQILNEITFRGQIDLLNAFLIEQKEQSKILKAIRRRLGILVAFIIILILGLAGSTYLIYSLMLQMRLY